MQTFTDEDLLGTKEFEKLVPGKYKMRIVDVVEKDTKAGDPMWSLTLETDDGGRVYDNLVFSQKARFISAAKLKALGVEKGDDGVYRVEPADIIDAYANVTLVESEWNGKKKLEPDFNSPGKGYTPVTQEDTEVPF